MNKGGGATSAPTFTSRLPSIDGNFLRSRQVEPLMRRFLCFFTSLTTVSARRPSPAPPATGAANLHRVAQSGGAVIALMSFLLIRCDAVTNVQPEETDFTLHEDKKELRRQAELGERPRWRPSPEHKHNYLDSDRRAT